MDLFKRGQVVLVKLYPNNVEERVVLEEGSTYVLCCRKELYQELLTQKLGTEGFDLNYCMGFPKEDVTTTGIACST